MKLEDRDLARPKCFLTPNTASGMKALPAVLRAEALDVATVHLRLEGGAAPGAKVAGRDHGRVPLPVGTRAGRRMRCGKSASTGAAGEGSRRRGCAMYSVLESCSACGRFMGRSAGPVEPCCHGLNIVAAPVVCHPICHPININGLGFRTM